jgi:hypothetical protein
MADQGFAAHHDEVLKLAKPCHSDGQGVVYAREPWRQYRSSFEQQQQPLQPLQQQQQRRPAAGVTPAAAAAAAARLC